MTCYLSIQDFYSMFRYFYLFDSIFGWTVGLISYMIVLKGFVSLIMAAMEARIKYIFGYHTKRLQREKVLHQNHELHRYTLHLKKGVD